MSSPHWFVAEKREWDGDHIALDAGESRHARNVLRIAPSDPVTITDGRGAVASCTVAEVGERVVAHVVELTTHERPKPELVIYQGAGKSRKADVVVERLAELGVAGIRVYESERTVVRWDNAKRRRLEDRWRAIARSAAKQARNPWMVETGPVLPWNELVERIAAETTAVCLWEEARQPLRSALPERADRIALIVGPEGGLARGEAEALANAGAALVSLGPTILRTENAPIVAASAVLYRYGRIG